MLAYTYIEKGKFALVEKPKPSLIEPTDAIATIAALYEKPQQLPLPQMYGKNLTFKTGGVDGCDCEETLHLIEEGRTRSATPNDTEAIIKIWLSSNTQAHPFFKHGHWMNNVTFI